MAHPCSTTTAACVSAQFMDSRGYGTHGGERATHCLLRQQIVTIRKCRAFENQRPPKGHSCGVLSNPVKRERSAVVVVVAAAVSSSPRDQEQEHEHEHGHEKGIVRLPMSVDYIASPGNAYIKHLVRLRHNPKARSATASVLVVGTVPLREICESVEKGEQSGRGTKSPIDVLLVREDAAQSLVSEELGRVSRRIVRVSADAMSRLSGLDSPPELAGVLGFPPTFTSFQPFSRNSSSSSISHHDRTRKWCCNEKPRRILVLDAIQDPGNLGTLLRTAAAFAWEGVFLLHGCCDPFNDKALRASRGAGFRVPIGVGEWEHVREFAVANELKLYAGDPQPQPEVGSANGSSTTANRDKDDELEFPFVDDGQGLCLVLGSEGQGLSDRVMKDCVPIGIPMPGNFESLNVAVAGGILMFLLK